MTFTKEHLLEAGYEWNFGTETRSLKEITPTRNRFDRFNGNCVLHMLNLFNHLVAHLSLKDGQYLESLITKELPLELSSEISVFNWLKRRYTLIASPAKLN